MNYRHHFHAGNFADVMKHALLVRLARGLQRKPKGVLFLDTHAGRGAYDLSREARGDTLERKPEWPEGIGRLWAEEKLPPELAEYADLVRRFQEDGPSPESGRPDLRRYPGSPELFRLLAREQDRLALCELHPEEFQSLQARFARARRTAVHEMDGYTALRAMLPPSERRGLVLIDPPYEAQDEWARAAAGLREAVDRFPSGVYAVWYPLTERAGAPEFLEETRAWLEGGAKARPTALVAELEVGRDAPAPAAPDAGSGLKGCGLLVVNPPWQFEREADLILQFLAKLFRRDEPARAAWRWLAPERPSTGLGRSAPPFPPQTSGHQEGAVRRGVEEP